MSPETRNRVLFIAVGVGLVSLTLLYEALGISPPRAERRAMMVVLQQPPTRAERLAAFDRSLRNLETRNPWRWEDWPEAERLLWEEIAGGRQAFLEELP